MSSIQERLQLKRVPLDNWSVKEKLCLASAVACSGDQNWMSVSRSLKMLCPSNRPSDWFSQKFCAAQYGKLLENVDTPKRKKRTEKDAPTAVETPSEAILRKLTQERILELKKLLAEEEQQYANEKEDITLVQNADETKLREMWNQIEMENKQKEREQFQYAQMLKAREERKLELEKAWRPGLAGQNSPKTSLNLKLKTEDMDVDDSGSQSTPPIKHGTSPLLTSLLKSPSPAPGSVSALNTSSNSLNNASVVRNLLNSKPTFTNETLSFQQAQQTLTEQNKLSDISVQLDSSSSSSSLPGGRANDGTNVKSEPTAFQDLTEGSPSPTANESAKEEEQLMDVFNGLIPDNIDELADILTDPNDIILSPELLGEEESILDNVDSLIAEQEEAEKAKSSQSTNDTSSVIDQTLQNDTSEIKHDTSDICTNEESKNVQDSVAAGAKAKLEESNKTADKAEVKNDESSQDEMHDVVIIKEDDEEFVLNESVANDEMKKEDEIGKTESPMCDIRNETEDQNNDVVMAEESTTDNIKDNIDDPEKEETTELPEIINSVPSEAEKSVEIINLEEDNTQDQDDNEKEAIVTNVDDSNDGSEDNKPISEIKEEALKYTPTIEIKSNESSVENRKLSSDDEVYEDAKDFEEEPKIVTPVIELIQQQETPICIVDTDEESPSNSIKDEKTSKSKRDYSRKKPEITKSTPEPSTSRPQIKLEDPPAIPEDKSNLSIRMKLKDRDRSESPLVLDDDNDETPRTRRRYSSTPVIDSIPSSPASSDDRDFRMWKKNIYNIYNRITSHKHANLFLKIEDNFPMYKSTVLRPIDLPSLRKNVDAGLIKTTAEFQRDIMLMCHNLIMVLPRNSPDISSVIEFRNEALSTIESILDVIKKEDKTVIATPIGVNTLTKGPGRPGRKSSRVSNI